MFFIEKAPNLELCERPGRKFRRGLLFLAMLLGAMVPTPPASTAERVTVPARPNVEVTLEGDLMTVTADSANLTEVLLAIGTRLGFEITVYGSLPDERTNWSLVGLTPLELVRRLVSDYDNVTLHSVSAPGGLSRLEMYAEPQESLAAPMSRQEDFHSAFEPSETMSEIEELEASLADPDPTVQMDAISSLGALGSDRAVQVLGRILFGNPHLEARLMAVEVLARQAQAEKGAAKAFLTSAAQDTDDFVREAATRALERLSE